MRILLDLAAFVFWVLVIVMIGAILPRSWRSALVSWFYACYRKVTQALLDVKRDLQAEEGKHPTVIKVLKKVD